MNPDRWQQLDELFHAALGIHYSVDRKSTRLNSSHDQISYAVFCLKKKRTRLNSSHDQISYAVFCSKKKTKQKQQRKSTTRRYTRCEKFTVCVKRSTGCNSITATR